MKFLLIPFVFFILLLCSCNRKGCSNPLADNYDENVKKARDKDCTFGSATLSPCGNQVTFCAKLDTLSLSGLMVKETFQNSVLLTYEVSSPTYRKLELEIFDPKEGNFTASNTNGKNTFKASYVDDNGVRNHSTGSLKISKFNTIDGLSGVVDIKFDDGSELSSGYIYKVQ